MLDMARAREAFENSTDFTVGIEEEFQILDPDTLALAQRRRVPLDVPRTLFERQILDEARLHSLVAVEHEDWQQRADLRPHVLGAPEVVQLRLPLLGEHDDLVAGAAPLPCERTRVDVRARPAQQVPEPEQDLQVKWK